MGTCQFCYGVDALPVNIQYPQVVSLELWGRAEGNPNGRLTGRTLDPRRVISNKQGHCKLGSWARGRKQVGKASMTTHVAPVLLPAVLLPAVLP